MLLYMTVNDMSVARLFVEEVTIDYQDILPLREPTFFILLSIAEAHKHGYAILKGVESLSNGKVKLSNGTLYGALVRLQDQGLIERVSKTEPPDSGRPRKAYRLTSNGRRVLVAEIDRMQHLIDTASASLAGNLA
jgi:DNA-binding PadR family transcriptional regulator